MTTDSPITAPITAPIDATITSTITAPIPAYEQARALQANTAVIAEYAKPFEAGEEALNGKRVGEWLTGSPCHDCESFNTVKALFYYDAPEWKGYLNKNFCISCPGSYVR